MRIFLIIEQLILFNFLGKKRRCTIDYDAASSSTDSGKWSTNYFETVLARLKRESIRSSTRANYHKVWKLFNNFYIKLDNKPNAWGREGLHSSELIWYRKASIIRYSAIVFSPQSRVYWKRMESRFQKRNLCYTHW